MMNWGSIGVSRPGRRAGTVIRITGGLALMAASGGAFAQATGDYRSKTVSGNWGTAASWERFDGTSWVTAPAPPSNTDGQINILSGHSIAVAANTSTDQTFVDLGGTLTVNSGNTFTLASTTAGTDLTINGTMVNSGSWMATASWNTTNTTWTVNGTYVHNTAGAIATPLNSATLASGSTFIYRGSSSLNTSVAIAGRTYSNLAFESSLGSWNVGAFSGNTAWTVNGDLTVGANVNVNYGSYTGTTTFKGNVTVNGALGATNAARSFSIENGKTLTVGSTGTVNIADGHTLTIKNGGVAQVDGTLGGLGSLVVAAGGTLRGNGLLGSVNVAGTISPGNSIDTLETGNQTWQGGGKYVWEATNTTTHDLIQMASLTVNATPGDPFQIDVSPVGTIGQGNWVTIAEGTDITGWDPDAFVLPTNYKIRAFDTTNNVEVDTSSFTGSFAVQVQATPEPTATFLFGGGAAALALGRRRRPR